MLLKEGSSSVEETGCHFCGMEEKKMTRTVKINGMMCANCEAHVKKALEALSEIDQVTPNHESNEAILELNAEISDETIKKAVEEAGYEFVG